MHCRINRSAVTQSFRGGDLKQPTTLLEVIKLAKPTAAFFTRYTFDCMSYLSAAAAGPNCEIQRRGMCSLEGVIQTGFLNRRVSLLYFCSRRTNAATPPSMMA